MLAGFSPRKALIVFIELILEHFGVGFDEVKVEVTPSELLDESVIALPMVWVSCGVDYPIGLLKGLANRKSAPAKVL